MVAQACNPSFGRQRLEDQEFNNRQFLKPAWAVRCLSKQNNKTENTKHKTKQNRNMGLLDTDQMSIKEHLHVKMSRGLAEAHAWAHAWALGTP